MSEEESYEFGLYLSEAERQSLKRMLMNIAENPATDTETRTTALTIMQELG